MKARFLASGGIILEDTAFRSAEVYPEGVSIRSGLACASSSPVDDDPACRAAH